MFLRNAKKGRKSVLFPGFRGFLADFFEFRSRHTADGALITLGQLPFVDVAADGALPFFCGSFCGSRLVGFHILAFVGGRFRRGFAFYHAVIIVVGHDRIVAQRLSGGHLADEHDVGAQIHRIDHLAAVSRCYAVGNIADAVFVPLRGKTAEFIKFFRSLKAERTDEIHVRLFGQDSAAELARFQNGTGGAVILVQGDGQHGRLSGHLLKGIGDAAAVKVARDRADNI